MNASHLLYLFELCVQVVQVEFVFLHLLHGLGGCLLINGVLRLVDEGQHIAHAEDSARHSVRVERLDIVELFAYAREFYRLAGYRQDCQSGTASGVAVQLGEDNARDVEGFIEALCDVHRVLTGHGVDNEEYLARICLALYVA